MAYSGFTIKRDPEISELIKAGIFHNNCQQQLLKCQICLITLARFASRFHCSFKRWFGRVSLRYAILQVCSEKDFSNRYPWFLISNLEKNFSTERLKH